jgi:hypothetical protein
VTFYLGISKVNARFVIISAILFGSRFHGQNRFFDAYYILLIVAHKPLSIIPLHPTLEFLAQTDLIGDFSPTLLRLF